MAFTTSDYNRVLVDVFWVCSIGELYRIVSAGFMIDAARKKAYRSAVVALVGEVTT